MAVAIAGVLLLPALASAATFNRPLSLGNTGPDVSALQTFLKDKGFFSTEATGYFGNVTKDALAKYQASVGLEAVGAVGPKTLALLNGTVPSTTLSTLITSLQQLLRNAGYFEVSLTGVLDPATLAAAQSVSSGTNTAPKRSGGRPERSEEEVPAAVHGPEISAVSVSTTGTTATIRWNTDLPADSRVDYGAGTSYGTASTSAALLTRHAIVLTGLDEETEYQYRIQSTDADGIATVSDNETFETTAWFDETALVDLDLSGARYWYDDVRYGDTSSFIGAVGATTSSSTITIEPKVVGAEVLSNPTFDTDITGWTAAVANTNLSWDSGRLLNAIPASGNSAFSQLLALTGSTAYRLCGDIVSMSSTYASRLAVSVNQNVSAPGSGLYGETAADANLGQKCAYVGYGSGTAYFGVRGSATGAVNVVFDNFSLKAVEPLVGYDHTVLSGIIEGVTPATATGNQVVFQADANSERDRLRVVWDATKHLRLMGTNANIAQIGVGGSIDLGVVDESTPFTVKFVSTGNGFKASLNDGEIFSDTLGTHPGLAYVRIGRSYTGEEWGGDIGRVTLFAHTLSDAMLTNPQAAFVAYGDSTAFATGSTVGNEWYNVLRVGYTPDRTAVTKGIGGETAAQMVNRVTADTVHRTWTTIFMDRPNTGETGAEWLASMKEAAALLDTDRWVVVPPVLNSPSAGGDSSATAIGEVQAALLSDPDFSGHTFDAAQQAQYIADLSGDGTRSDGIHYNNTGQALQAGHIRTFLDSAGW